MYCDVVDGVVMEEVGQHEDILEVQPLLLEGGVLTDTFYEADILPQHETLAESGKTEAFEEPETQNICLEFEEAVREVAFDTPIIEHDGDVVEMDDVPAIVLPVTLAKPVIMTVMAVPAAMVDSGIDSTTTQEDTVMTEVTGRMRELSTQNEDMRCSSRTSNGNMSEHPTPVPVPAPPVHRSASNGGVSTHTRNPRPPASYPPADRPAHHPADRPAHHPAQNIIRFPKNFQAQHMGNRAQQNSQNSAQSNQSNRAHQQPYNAAINNQVPSKEHPQHSANQEARGNTKYAPNNNRNPPPRHPQQQQQAAPRGVKPPHREAVDDEYSYVPANQVFLPDGAINPSYLPLFPNGYFMFKKVEAPFLASAMHIFGITVNPKENYIVYIPALRCEQSVLGSALSLNPNEPNPRAPTSFHVHIAGKLYIANRIRSAPKLTYDPEKHQLRVREQQQLLLKQQSVTGSGAKYVDYPPPIDTFTIFGVPVYRAQSYYVYVPMYNTEYAVQGDVVSPNPDNSSTLYVTIHRRRYQGTSLRPVFPDLVFKQAQEEYENQDQRPEQVPEERTGGNLVAFGIQIAAKETYYVYIPEMRTEYIVFGSSIESNPADANSVIITVNAAKLIGTSVRPTGIKNNPVKGDGTGDGTTRPPPPGKRYQLIAFGVPVDPSLMYEVYLPSRQCTETVLGCYIGPNKEDANTILVSLDMAMHVGTSIKLAESADVASDSGETVGLKGIITAFGIPILPTEKYVAFVPELRSECVVEGRRIHTNPADEQSVLVFISGYKFKASSLRTARDLLRPKYPVGTIIHSSERRYRTIGSTGTTGSDTTLSEDDMSTPHRSQGATKQLNISKQPLYDNIYLDFSLVKDQPAQAGSTVPKYVVNNAWVFEDKYYCVYMNDDKQIVKGTAFTPHEEDPNFFNVQLNDSVRFVESYFVVVQVSDGPVGPKKLAVNTNSAFGKVKE